ncbi:MAG: 4Fe-4S binding protein [Desulfuromonadales bacterium]
MTIDRQTMEVDIACVGFGPATAGFMHTLSQAMTAEDGSVLLESKVMPGMPLQVVCYERADDIGFGVSGVVTRGKALRESLPDLDPAQMPMAASVSEEQVLFLQDPLGKSRRSKGIRLLDGLLSLLGCRDHAVKLPYIPRFLCKEGGLVLSVGQFSQWIGSQLIGSGLVQVWPGMPVSEPLIEENRVVGIRLVDQGVELDGRPGPGYMPGMDIRAALSVVGDGPVGPVGQKLDDHFGLPDGHHQDEWAGGMKFVVELPEDCTLKPGFVLHTLGYPEPEIFGFLYVYPDRVAALGIFVPSWLDSPVRSTYRLLQYWMQHPAIWKHLKGGRLRSWGAKSLQESGQRGEPLLAGDGFARIGEGSGSTNVLSGSGLDEAWATGVQLAEAVIELEKSGEPYSRANLERTYLARRRASWVENDARIAKKARDGFTRGMIPGLVGMALSGISNGRFNVGGVFRRPWERIPSYRDYLREQLSAAQIDAIVEECRQNGKPPFEPLMDKLGWPPIEYDGELLLSHQDALLIGGKVQAAPGFADHVYFVDPGACDACESQICVAMCSGQAIYAAEGGGVPQFDREKCIHCGICMWNCTTGRADDPMRSNVSFASGSGGLHSAEN